METQQDYYKQNGPMTSLGAHEDEFRALPKDIASLCEVVQGVLIHRDKPLLIQGASGAGKTSLIRAMAGIWREGHGTVMRPAMSDVMFLPQRPYVILGSLRDQLVYPRAAEKPTNN